MSIESFYEFFFRSLSSCVNNNPALMDAAEPWQLSFQDPATPIAEGIMLFHHDLMFFYYHDYGFCNVDVVQVY